MQQNFLDQEIRKLQNKCVVSEGEIWLMFELVTHLTINGELSLYESEKYTHKLFKIMDGARGS